MQDCEIQAVGVSSVPRDAEGSYMPCFLSGKAVADILGATHNVPVYEFSHQSGHIMAALYSCGNADELLKKDFVAFHVSGGTTEAVYVAPDKNKFVVSIIAETADISAGQAIDLRTTEDYSRETLCEDLREAIHPKRENSILEDLGLKKPYFQVFAQKHGFQSDLSIMDLLFNEGPESILYLISLCR